MRNKLTKNIVLSAMIATIAWLSVFVFRLDVQFLTYDIKDAIITIGGLICGPVWVVPMAIIASFLEMISTSATGWYGFIMNAASSIAFAFVACAVYNHFKTFSSALIGLIFAVISMTGVMLLMNMVITPRYFAGTNVKDVIDMIPKLLLPFNLTKAIMNAAIVMLLYKPLIKTLRKVGIIRYSKASTVQNGTFKTKNESLASLFIGLLLFTIALAIFFWYFKASIPFFN